MNLFDLAAKITLDTGDFEKGISDARSSASGLAGLLQGIGGAVTTVGGALASAGALVVGTVMNQASKTAEYGDNIDKMSQKLGMSATAYQEWDFIMQHSGTTIDAMQSSMKTLATAAESGSSAFEELGVSTEGLNQEELFSATITALQNMDDTTQRTYLSGQLLGRGATELGALLNTSAEDTEAMRQQVHDLGGVMSDEAVKSAAAYQDSLQNMKTSFDSIKNTLGSALMPAITTAMDGITNIVGKVSSAFQEGGIKGVLDEIAQGFEDLTGIDISGLTDSIGRTIESVTETVQKLADAFKEGGIKGVLDELIKGFEGMTGLDLSPILSGVSDFITNFKEGAPEAMEHFRGAIDKLKTALDKIGLTDIIQKVIDFVGNLISSFDGAAVIDFAASAIEAFSKGLEAAIEWIAQAGESIKTFFTKTIPEAAKNIGTSLSEKIDEIVKFFAEDIPNAVSGAVEAIKNKVSDFIQAGKDLIQGFINGVTEKINAAKDAITGAAGKVIDWVKGIFDEHSPSRVFKQIGMYAMEGLAIGFEDGYDKFKSDIGKSIYGLIPDRISSSVDFASSGIGKASVGTVNGIIAASSSQSGNYNINLVVDGKTLAGVVYDPLNKIIKQKGAAANA